MRNSLGAPHSTERCKSTNKIRILQIFRHFSHHREERKRATEASLGKNEGWTGHEGLIPGIPRCESKVPEKRGRGYEDLSPRALKAPFLRLCRMRAGTKDTSRTCPGGFLSPLSSANRQPAGTQPFANRYLKGGIPQGERICSARRKVSFQGPERHLSQCGGFPSVMSWISS